MELTDVVESSAEAVVMVIYKKKRGWREDGRTKVLCLIFSRGWWGRASEANGIVVFAACLPLVTSNNVVYSTFLTPKKNERKIYGELPPGKLCCPTQYHRRMEGREETRKKTR